MIRLPEFEDEKGPILMLNMVKFKDRRLYFEKYIPAFYQVVDELGISGAKVTLANNVIANIVAAEDEVWDAIVLVEYPSIEAFKVMAESDVYRDIAEPLRIASLEDIKLFMTRSTKD